jgi:hypothetical protein
MERVDTAVQLELMVLRWMGKTKGSYVMFQAIGSGALTFLSLPTSLHA